jgi:predicted SnoaL-like aldol condensation-catalyzing enzyme
MSIQTEALRELVSLFNRRQPIEIERFFAPDFRLDQPGGVHRVGLAGAREMAAALHAMGESARLEILEMIEQGDLVAVRWQVSGLPGPNVAMMAMYRFVDGRITDDWGIAVPAPWQDVVRG